MRIELGKIVLCDETVDNGAQDYREVQVRNIEQVVPARSEKVRLRNRGAVKRMITFKVEREFATVLAAENFWEEHQRSIPALALMTKTATGDGSEMSSVSVYANAAVEEMEPTFFGVTVTISYKIIAEPPQIRKEDAQ